jgi:hypothetical protein
VTIRVAAWLAFGDLTFADVVAWLSPEDGA